LNSHYKLAITSILRNLLKLEILRIIEISHQKGKMQLVLFMYRDSDHISFACFLPYLLILGLKLRLSKIFYSLK